MSGQFFCYYYNTTIYLSLLQEFVISLNHLLRKQTHPSKNKGLLESLVPVLH